jgi:hypothetical protein
LPDEPPIGEAETYSSSILAVMLYPRFEDSDNRRHWHAAAAASAYHHFRKEGAPWQVLIGFHGWVGELWELPQAPRRVFKDGVSRMKRASLSGDILEFLLRLALHHPAHCRAERAKALVQEVRGRKAPSASQLDKAWAWFKTASPLWLARRSERARGGALAGNARWLDMLAVAEHYRRTAESLRLLLPAETWKVPEYVILPNLAPAIEPLPVELAAFLDREFPA